MKISLENLGLSDNYENILFVENKFKPKKLFFIYLLKETLLYQKKVLEILV